MSEELAFASAQESAEPLIEYGPLNPRPHPFLPTPTPAEIDAAMATPEGAKAYLEWYNDREERIAKSETPGEMYRYAFELDCWHDADRDLANARTDGRDYGGLYVGGGKRSTKSSWASFRFTQSALTYGDGILWGLQRELKISIITMQRMIWSWLPKRIRDLNDPSGKRKGDSQAKIRYSKDGGFTEGVLVLPNSTMIQFLSYKMDPKDYQGAEIGAHIRPRTTAKVGEYPWIARVDASGRAYYSNGVPIPNIGAWLDEDAPLAWIGTVKDRLTTRNAKAIWTFTTENGITRAVKSTVGSGTNVETRPADDMLPQNRVLVRGCPNGHVPYRQKTVTPGWNAIYFFTRFNRFGDSYANMAAQYNGKAEPMILANLYGYSEDIFARAYPLFGGWNIVEDWELPAEGTNYLICDPAGSRNFCFIWVRIAPGMGGEDWYIFDEWPDAQRYGAWAIPDDSQDPNPDGLPGPAQRNLGWGIERYKQMLAERQRIIVPPAELWRDLEKYEPGTREHRELLARFGLADPQRRRLAERAAAAAAEDGDVASILEIPIHKRFIDPRAAATPSQEQRGSKTLIDKFREETKDPAGKIVGPRLEFLPAPGLDVQTGIATVQQRLYFNDKEEIIKGYNAPKLFVARRCQQVIWMFENYTAQGGESGGCKDIADLVRYAGTTRDLRYVAPGPVKTTGGRRSY